MARPSILAFVLAAGVGVGDACVLVDEERSMPIASGRKMAPPEPPDSALVDELDRGIQARFKNVRDEDIHNRNLGTSRVAYLGWRRRGTIRKELLGELRTLSRLSEAGWEAAVYVVEPGKEGTINGPITATSDGWLSFPDLAGIREVADRATASGVSARGQGKAVSLEARPVPASEGMCLRCHRGNKLGQPLGAVVYAFRDAVLPRLLDQSLENPVTFAAARSIGSGGPR